MRHDPCTERKRVSRIVVEENKSKATFINDDNRWYCVVKVDGCLCKNEEAADWVVKKEGIGAVIVELKGRDVPHGVRQVWATAKFWRQHEPDCKRISGLVVSRQRPSYSASSQKLQIKFAREFNYPLRIVS